jgi:Domain of unknown function (DUF4389)
MQPSEYPLEFSVEYPDRDLNRLSTAFRIFAVIPIWIILIAISGGGGWGGSSAGSEYWPLIGTGAGLLVLAPGLMILFRKKYPRWWYDWNLELLRFSNRVGVYFLLMDDRYPSTDEQQSVRLEFPYPDVEAELERGMPIIKWLLAIPHYIVLFVLDIGVFFAVIGAWFAIIFTGRYPRGIFGYLEGVIRWHNRVAIYAFALTTDRYPPFRLSP